MPMMKFWMTGLGGSGGAGPIGATDSPYIIPFRRRYMAWVIIVLLKEFFVWRT